MKKLLLICAMGVSSTSYSQIDTSIYQKQMEIQQRQQAQNQAAMSNLGSNFGSILLNRRVSQMRQLESIEEKRAFANKSLYRAHLNRVLDRDIAEEQAQDRALAKHNAEIANLKAQTDKINAQTRLNILRSNSLSVAGGEPDAIEERVYIEHIEEDLYKTDDGRLIKTQSCYQYVYNQKATIMKSKLIFKNGSICNIEKIIDI